MLRKKNNELRHLSTTTTQRLMRIATKAALFIANETLHRVASIAVNRDMNMAAADKEGK